MKLLRQRGLRPKKSFGQCFLQDQRACARIAELAIDPVGGTALEIGAGLGALTRPLAERAERVIAVERDRDLVPILREQLGDLPSLAIVEADAVQLDWCAQLAGGPRPHVIVGNLPYQLTGRLLRRTTEIAGAIDAAVFMLQREVAQRLIALPASGSYGALTVFVQAAFDVERAFVVAAGAFAPVPDVDSAVVVLTPRRPPRAEETADFRELVKRAFGTRRKTLRNAWRGLGGLDRDDLAERARAAGIDLGARGETLSVEDFARMAQTLR